MANEQTGVHIPMFGIVKWFVRASELDKDSLASIASNLLGLCSPCKIGYWDDGVSTIPLFICDKRDDLKRSGALCPHELVIERTDLLPGVDAKGRLTYKANDVLTGRLRVLENLYGNKTRAEFIGYMRDWLAGAFRMYLMLDATTHGTSEFIDLEKVRDGKDPILTAVVWPDKQTIIGRCFGGAVAAEVKANEAIKHAKTLRNRFSPNSDSNEEILKFKHHAEQLFPEYFKSWNEALGLEKQEEQFVALNHIYCDDERKVKVDRRNDDNQAIGQIEIDGKVYSYSSVPRQHDDRLPVAFGDRAKYVTPTGKLNLLLIDDNVDRSPFYYLAENDKPSCEGSPVDFSSTISQNDWTLLSDIFNVKTMPVDKKNGDIYKTALQRFREFHQAGLTFDLILVDLCLGNNRQGSDLDGYAMIRIVKVFFPGTPIVVYSRFSDMEHIARAFFSGAKWFLVKGDEAKLPRHVLKLLKQVGWHREWRTVKNSFHAPRFLYDKKDDFSRRFDRAEEWKYLTYKSLEYFPGKFITIKCMGGGISSAVTFKATKGVKLGGDFLQTPCIIKIDTSYNTMMEFERYFRMIRPYIANECGRVEMPERVLNRTYSPIVYTFAGKQDKAHTLESMGDMLDDNVACQTACDYETYRYAMQCIFDEILPKIHRVSPELEFADIGKSSALPAEVMDAFAWKDVPVRKSSFPNYYFCEFEPSEFWKSYMLRMQPWGRITIDFKADWPFKIQETPDAKKRLIFHNVMTEPFARKDEEKAGKRIIEAYTDDRRLVWLEGDACDFVARFRKRVSPGTSLWLDEDTYRKLEYNVDKLCRIGNANEASQKQGESVESGSSNGRMSWLNDTFEYKGNGGEDVRDGFISAIAVLSGILRDSDMKKVELQNDVDMEFYVRLQDAVLNIAIQASEKDKAKADEWGMKCPVGIVHGDLNVKNIMLESRMHPPKEDDPDVTKKVSDVWLIDFARTRRDIIAHDFNVFFTSVLGELFTEGLIGKEDKEKSVQQIDYWEKLVSNFRTIVTAAVAPESKSEKGVPDEIKDDKRFTLIYRILRRTHDAAMVAGVSQNMYLLTTALACLYTLKIFLNNGCKVRLAAGYFVAAWICYDLLCEAIDIDNEMKGYKRVEGTNTSVLTAMDEGAQANTSGNTDVSSITGGNAK